MGNRDETPIACTLQPGDYQQRLALIAEVARSGLLATSRRDLRLELRYALHMADRVRELVDKEQVCCAFLDFELTQTGEDVRLAITVPERARDVADALFEPFVTR